MCPAGPPVSDADPESVETKKRINAAAHPTATLLTTGQHIAHISQSSLPPVTGLMDPPPQCWISLQPPPFTSLCCLCVGVLEGEPQAGCVERERVGWAQSRHHPQAMTTPHPPPQPHTHTPALQHPAPSSFCRAA